MAIQRCHRPLAHVGLYKSCLSLGTRVGRRKFDKLRMSGGGWERRHPHPFGCAQGRAVRRVSGVRIGKVCS